MSFLAAESPVSAVAAFDEDAWEDLLNYIEEKRVIPIVGPELAVVQTDAGPLSLNDVVVRHLANRGRREGCLNSPVPSKLPGLRDVHSRCDIRPISLR